MESREITQKGLNGTQLKLLEALLMLVFYYGRDSKKVCIFTLGIVAIMSFVYGGTSLTIANLLTNNQWMMVFAGLFILLYNGEKGKGYKRFFYVFYPAHLYILYILGWFLAGGK